MRLTILAVASIVLFGCDEDNFVRREADQCLRKEIFAQCMASLPVGPQSTHYNDWSEVVDSCASVAYYQSLRLKTQIKPECF